MAASVKSRPSTNTRGATADEPSADRLKSRAWRWCSSALRLDAKARLIESTVEDRYERFCVGLTIVASEVNLKRAQSD